MSRSMGWLIIVAGVCAIIIGGLILAGGLSWFGRLPGDLRIEGERSRVYIPLTSMLLISLALSLIAYLVRRFF